jgi:hypothetical protein
MTDTGFLCFTRTKYKGKSCYGCRGMGPRYMAFYKWAQACSYKCVHDDMPWDYFVFVRHADEEEFLDTYSGDFI